MSSRSTPLALERLETRDTPGSLNPANYYLNGPGINLTVTNVHYAGPTSSQPITGTVRVSDPHHATGKFDVVAVWAERLDAQGRPAGRVAVAGTDTEVVTASKIQAGVYGQGFKIQSATARPAWAKFVVVQVNPAGQVPETTLADNYGHDAVRV